MDRTLTYKNHIGKTAAKLKSRNNILSRLAGTSWGADASTLRTTALAVVYSPAEYCAGIWLNSSHCQLVDIQLRQTMRIISGTLRCTPSQWLPVLCNIAPPHLRRQQALVRLWCRIMENDALPVHHDVKWLSKPRLKSRKPACKTAVDLTSTEFNLRNAWRDEWLNSTPHGLLPISDPTTRLAGFSLPRTVWSRLNRIRCSTGRTGAALYQWGWIDSPKCDCGSELQTMKHIVLECPLRAYPGTLDELHSASPEAITWILDLNIHI